MQRIIIAMMLLFIGAPAIAASVDVCHLSDEGDVNAISISEKALDAHMAHGDHLVQGDVSVNEDGDCVFQVCLGEQYYAGLGYGDFYNEFTVLYVPESGEIIGTDLAGTPVTGLISPAGYSIFRAGSYYSYTYMYADPLDDFVGSGMTFDDSGTFVGIWKRPDDRDDTTSSYPAGEADADYTFTQGACSD